jgi:hypothetical protein
MMISSEIAAARPTGRTRGTLHRAAAAIFHAGRAKAEGAVASKKTQRAITAAEVPHVFDDACADRLAELLEPLSPRARHEIKLYVDWYLNVALDLGPDTAAAYADATRLSAEARFVVAKAKRDVAAAAYVPPEFDQMHEAAVALADRLKSVGVNRVVSSFFRAQLIACGNILPDEQAIQDRLESLLTDLDWFASQLTAVRKYKRPLKRGPKARGRQFAEMVASVITRDMGERIKRSKNRDSLFALLTEIVAIVGIGSATVEEVVRGRRKRLRRGEISPEESRNFPQCCRFPKSAKAT